MVYERGALNQLDAPEFSYGFLDKTFDLGSTQNDIWP